MSAATTSVVLTTARQPGAIALIQLHGDGAAALLRAVTGRTDWPRGRLQLVRFGEIDEGLAVLLDAHWAQLMPHGGPRVVQRLADRLIERGAVYDREPSARALYPEADSDIEADALATIARAASPAAIDLLAKQPALWREAVRFGVDAAALRDRSAVLDQLVDPPTVVVVGAPNVGKSTLTNAILGRSVSVVADLPGTTRDWVAGVAELGAGSRAVAVRWLDTPGLRMTEGVERRAIELAQRVVRDASVLLAMRDGETDWPGEVDLPREPDVWVVNKVDDGTVDGDGASRDEPLAISAANERGLDALAGRVLRTIGLADVGGEELWAFSPPLRAVLESGGDVAGLGDYVSKKKPTA